MSYRSIRPSRLAPVASLTLALAARVASAQDAGIAPPAPSPAAPLRVVATADLDGQIATADCGAADRANSPFARAAERLAAAPDAIAIDGGNLIGSAAVSRAVITLDADGFARTVAAAGWRAVALAHRDLAAPRATLLAATAALDRAGVPALLSNVTCNASARAVCAQFAAAATSGARLIHGPTGTLAVVAVVDPDWLGFVAHDRSAGLTLTDPVAAIARATAAARAAGADRVVAVYDPPWGDEVPHALALATRLPQGGRPDLLLVHGVGAALHTAVAATSGVPLAAFSPDASAVLVEPGQSPLEPTTPARTPGPGADAARAFAAHTTATLCARGSAPLTGARLLHPLDRDGFADLLLDVLRERAGAEIAIINRGAVVAPEGLFPLTDAIAPLDLTRALPFDNDARVGRVPGTVLKELLRSSHASEFYIRGAVVHGDHVTINGRPLEDATAYRVVTTDYVAQGGDAAFGAAHLEFEPWGTTSVRDQLQSWLALTRPQRDVTRAPIDPTNRTRWTLHATLDASLTSTVVDNPNTAVLPDAQLSRGQALALATDMTVHADADHPYFTWENHLRLRYAVGDTVPVGGPDPGLTETQDLIAARSVGVYRHVRRRGPPRWYDPLPYVEAYLESEFVRPPTRAYHHLELRPDVGVRFELYNHFSAHIGLGADWEVLATPAELTPMGPTIVPDFVIGWSLKPGTIFTLAGRPITAESLLDVVWRDPVGNPGLVGRFHIRLAVPIFQPIAVTLTYDGFARYATFEDSMDVRHGVWGWSGDLSLGLRISFDRAVQAYAY